MQAVHSVIHLLISRFSGIDPLGLDFNSLFSINFFSLKKHDTGTEGKLIIKYE